MSQAASSVPLPRDGALRSGLRRLLRLRVWVVMHLAPTPWQAALAWAALAGVVGSLGAATFRLATEGLHHLASGSDGGVVASFRMMPWWGRLALPAAGGLVAGAILLLGRRLARGEVASDYMEAIVIGTGDLPVRASLVKIGAAVFSIGSGGSIGREGPMVQLAAVLASRLGRLRSFSPQRLRLLVACGAAAGISSAYNAPIAGAFFVAEVVLGSIAMESLGPLVVASVAASLTMRGLSHVHPHYDVPHFSLGSLYEMGLYLVLGLLAGILAPWFLRSLRRAESLFALTGWPPPLRLGLGGLVVGLLALSVPEVCGNGYSVVLDILNGRILWLSLGVILLAKWLATLASFGSGSPGGAFTPSLFMGASAGYLFGSAMHTLVPGLAPDPRAFALVGMGAFLSAVTHAPVMAVIMLFEMTLSYDIILPLLACSVVAYYVAKGLEGQSLYTEALQRKTAAQPIFTPALGVRDLMKVDPPQVRAGARFAEIGRLFVSVSVNYVYVVDDARRFLGVIALRDIKPYLDDPDLAKLVIAVDIVRDEFPRVAPEQSLHEALASFLDVEAQRLPVVDEDRVLVGSLSRHDLLLAVQERLRDSARSMQPRVAS